MTSYDYQRIFAENEIQNLYRLNESLSRFNEKLEPINADSFSKQLEIYPDLKKLFTTPAQDLDPLYRNLVHLSNLPKYNDRTLELMVLEVLPLDRYTCLMSTSNGKMMGFIAYETDKFNRSYINNIKMFATDLNRTFSFLKDMDLLIESLVTKYKLISWNAFQRNEPGNKLYQYLVRKYKGFYQETGIGEDSSYIYFIPGTDKIPEEFKGFANIVEDFT